MIYPIKPLRERFTSFLMFVPEHIFDDCRVCILWTDTTVLVLTQTMRERAAFMSISYRPITSCCCRLFYRPKHKVGLNRSTVSSLVKARSGSPVGHGTRGLSSLCRGVTGIDDTLFPPNSLGVMLVPHG